MPAPANFVPRAALAILPSTVPGVGLEALLACLALRLPIMTKLATCEPHFSAAFVEELTRRLPDAAEAIAIGHWRGGDEAIESRVLDDLDPIVAYGDARTGRRSTWRSSNSVAVCRFRRSTPMARTPTWPKHSPQRSSEPPSAGPPTRALPCSPRSSSSERSASCGTVGSFRFPRQGGPY